MGIAGPPQGSQSDILGRSMSELGDSFGGAGMSIDAMLSRRYRWDAQWGLVLGKRLAMKYMLLIRPDVEFDGPVPAEMVAATEAWVAR